MQLPQTYSDGYGGKGKSNSSSAAAWADTDLRSKLVLLTLSFPRLRIIWSSSPYETVEIFRDLKENRDEPDAEKASNVGKDEDAGGTAAEGTGEAGGNLAVQEMLRALPGIKTNNYRYVMNKVQDLESLCEMDLKGMQGLIGVETGTAMYDFVNRDIRVKEKEKPEERET
jgi:DNA excision repair protein ERCC-4